MTINEHQIKLSGKANVISGLTNGKTYDLTISEAECRKIEEIPNDDGTCNRIALLRISELSKVNIIGEGEIIQSKKKKLTQSQYLRLAIERKLEQSGSDLEREDFYIKEMTRIISEYKNYS